MEGALAIREGLPPHTANRRKHPGASYRCKLRKTHVHVQWLRVLNSLEKRGQRGKLPLSTPVSKIRVRDKMKAVC